MLTLKLNIYSSNNSFEEFLTSIKLVGLIDGGMRGVFNIKGLAHSSAKDKLGELKADFVVGDITLIDNKVALLKDKRSSRL